jgi:integrase
MGRRRRDQKFLTDAETQALKDACETLTDQVIVYTLLYTGIRVGELVHLRPGWIDLEEGAITIPRKEGTWAPKRVKVLDNEGNVKKEYSGSRRIPILNAALLRILGEFRTRRRYRGGIGMTSKEVWVRLNQLWKSTGAQDRISPHYLRHTCLSKMLQADYSIGDIAAQAGHHNLDVTIKTYLHGDTHHLFREARKKGGIE